RARPRTARPGAIRGERLHRGGAGRRTRPHRPDGDHPALRHPGLARAACGARPARPVREAARHGPGRCPAPPGVHRHRRGDQTHSTDRSHHAVPVSRGLVAGDELGSGRPARSAVERRPPAGPDRTTAHRRRRHHPGGETAVNSPIRKVAAGCLLLCLALLVNVTYVQAFQADELNQREGNRRVLIDEYSRERGPILVGEPPTEIAFSTPVDGEFGFLRQYPEPELYAHATGFYSFIFGRSAIERAQNTILSGSDDRWFFRRLVDMVTGERPRGGAVKLTLNPAAQEAAYAALGDNKGAAVAIEPATGAILAMVSKPSWDPNPLASHEIPVQQEAWQELRDDEDVPDRNRAIAQTLPPGSVFKVVTAAAALENGFEPSTVVPGPAEYDLPQSTVGLPNYNGQPCGPNDETTITNALRISCNTAFAWLGNELGDDLLREQAERFGFNTAPLTNDDLNAARSVFPPDLDAPSTAQSAIGQRRSEEHT